jgi:hypothetical protein
LAWVGVGWRGLAWVGVGPDIACLHTFALNLTLTRTRWNDEGVGLKRLRASLAALAPAAEAR